MWHFARTGRLATRPRRLERVAMKAMMMMAVAVVVVEATVTVTVKRMETMATLAMVITTVIMMLWGDEGVLGDVGQCNINNNCNNYNNKRCSCSTTSSRNLVIFCSSSSSSCCNSSRCSIYLCPCICNNSSNICSRLNNNNNSNSNNNSQRITCKYQRSNCNM